MCICVLVRLTTEWASLHHVDEAWFELEVHLPDIDVGLVATLSVEGTENSWRVFSAIASRTSGASEMGSCAGRIARGGMTRGRALLTSLSG